MSESQEPFLLTLDSYRTAVLTRNVDAFAALYDDDVHVFDMWGTWSLRGIEAWRSLAADWFASLGTDRVLVGVSEASSTLSGDVAIGHAVLTYTAVSAEGRELRSLSNRITMALRRTGESWKVIHEHTSAPIDHQSTKAILNLASDA